MKQDCRILVLISGNGSNLQAIIDAYGPKNTPIVGVLSSNPDAYGLRRAHQYEINTSCVIKRNNETINEYGQRLMTVMDHYQANLIVLAGFMQILSAEVIHKYSGKIINIHPSLLPKYKGLNTHQRAIDNHDIEHGTSVHFVTEQLDAGPIILQAKVPIYPNDTANDLKARVQAQEHAIYPLVIDWFCQRRLKMKNEQAWLDNNLIGKQGFASD